ncbi:hypothetical protein CAI21_11545, partial [Alkalilimnicola ehrlichii]
MNLLKLTTAYLRANRLSVLLNLLLFALGMATIVTLLLVNHQVQDRLTRDAAGVDLVVGAKGSPLQIILANVFHIDVPTGNIPLADAEWVRNHPMVGNTIPLALGDNFQGYRIVGTEHGYVDLYNTSVREGGLWETDFQAVIGAEVAAQSGLTLGDTFVGVHGLGASDHVHGDHPYQVAGILAPSGTVLDRLILTSVNSVWAVHGHGHDHDHDHGHD